MPGEKPPRAQPPRTSLFDEGWEDDTTTQVDASALDDPTRVQPPRPVHGSETDVDDLLEELQPEDTYATVRRADVLPGLGGPPEIGASPLGGPAPFRVGPPSEPPGPPPQGHRPLPPPSVPPPQTFPVEPAQKLPPPVALEPPPLVASPFAAAPVEPPAPSSRAAPPQPSSRAAEAVPRSALPPSSGAGPAIDEALSKPVNIAGFSAQLGPVFVSGLAVLVLAAAAVGFAIGFGLGRSGAKHRAPAAPSSAEAAASNAVPSAAPAPTPTLAEAPPPVGSTTLDRAAGGDPAALAEIQARPAKARTIDEAVAIVAGQAATKMQGLEALGKELKQDPTKLGDAKIDRQLLDFARDDQTGWHALHIIAELETARSADLLYEIWTGTARHTASTELAEALLTTDAVRKHASPALAAALDLRDAKTCEDVKKLLPKVQANGDRRSLYMLGKLHHHSGCGAHKRDDCYACLRKGDAINDAVKAVRKHAPPKF
jgi:hypothetical protein